MNLERVGYTATLGELKVGTFAAYNAGTALGLRCELQGTARGLMFMIAPSGGEKSFGLNTSDDFTDQAAFVFAEATLIPDLAGLKIGYPDHPELGTLLGSRDQLLMVARLGSGSPVFVNMSNGQIEPSLGAGRATIVWFSGWRVARKLGDRYLEIVRFTNSKEST